MIIVIVIAREMKRGRQREIVRRQKETGKDVKEKRERKRGEERERDMKTRDRSVITVIFTGPTVSSN